MPAGPHHPRKLPKQRRSQQTFDRILDAAARIFDADGYAATTNDIAAEAGVSVGSLYQYFPNKDAILVALAERHVAEALALLQAELERLEAEAPPLRVVIERLVGLTIALNASDRLHELLAHRAPRTPALMGQFDQLASVVANGVAHHLRFHQRGGDDPELTARLLVHMVEAAVHDVVLRSADPTVRERAAERVVELVSSAVAGPSGTPP
jgi:AcrR family transcriptional regulator